MKIKSDFHSHVSHSSAHQMAEVAREKGLHVLGLSEHIFQMGEARTMLEHLAFEGPLLTFPGYIEAIHAAAQLPGLDVRLGMEVDFIPAQNDGIQRYLQGFPWDFLFGSVHEIDG